MIKPNEKIVSLVKNGFPQAEFAGLSPASNPLKSLLAIIQQKLGIIDFAELGSKLKLKQSQYISISYMGFAIRSLMT